jgi:uncharacterized protein (DUF486 family)
MIMKLPVIALTALRRALSNIFMTFAWYAHPKALGAVCIMGAVYFISRA